MSFLRFVPGKWTCCHRHVRRNFCYFTLHFFTSDPEVNGSHSFLAGHVGHVAAALHSKAAAGHPTHGHPINSTGTWRSAGILRLSDCWRSKLKRCHIWGRCRLRWEPRMWWNWQTWWNCGIQKNTMMEINEWKQYRKTINESMTFIAFLMDFRCGLTGQIGAFANSPVVVESRFGPARSRWWLRYQFDPATFQETDLVFDPFSSVHTWSRMNCALCIFTMSFHLDLFDGVEMPLVVVIFSFAAPRHASPGASAGRGPILRRKHKRHQSTSLSWTSNDQT